MTNSKWEGKTFLVVEDDEVSVEFIKELLAPDNVTLICVDNGEDAIEGLQGKFDY